MKLWLKVSLIAIILVTLAKSVCSLVMLLHSGKSNLDLARYIKILKFCIAQADTAIGI